MTPSLSLAARLRILAAPHRTDRLKVLRRISDIGMDRWNTITRLMGLPPGQHPDSIELCENADGQGGSWVRATHDGDRWFFVGRNRKWTRVDPMPWPPRADVEERGYTQDIRKQQQNVKSELALVLKKCVNELPEVSAGAYHEYATNTNVDLDFTYDFRVRRGGSREIKIPGFTATWAHTFDLAPGNKAMTQEQREEWRGEVRSFKDAMEASVEALRAWAGTLFHVTFHLDVKGSAKAPGEVWCQGRVRMIPNVLEDFEALEVQIQRGETYKELTQALEPLRTLAHSTYAATHGIDTEVLDFAKAAQLACVVRNDDGSRHHAKLDFEKLETPQGDDFALITPVYFVDSAVKHRIQDADQEAFQQWTDRQAEAFKTRIPELPKPRWAWAEGHRFGIYVVLGDDLSVLTPELAQRVGKAAARWMRAWKEFAAYIDQKFAQLSGDY